MIKDQIRAGWVLPLLVHATGGICGASAAEPAFTDVTKEVGGLSGYTTVHPYTAPHAAWGDFDNDGFLDFYLTTVYEGGKSVLYRNTSADFSEMPDPNSKPGESPVGKWRFQNVTDEAGVITESTYGAAWADYDNDGDLDLAAGCSKTSETKITG